MELEDSESNIDTESGIGSSREIMSEIDISIDQSDDVFKMADGVREFEREKIRRPSQTSILTIPNISPKPERNVCSIQPRYKSRHNHLKYKSSNIEKPKSFKIKFE